MSAAALFDYGLAFGPMVPASVKTVPDFLEWCKANPTQANFGSPAAGSSPHFIGALLGKAGNVALRHIAFRGTQPAVLDLMGGQIAASQDVIDGMASLYLEPLPTSPAQLAGMLKADTERWGPLVKAVGFTPEG